MELRLGTDDADDLDRIDASPAALEMTAERSTTAVRAHDAGGEVTSVVENVPRLVQAETPSLPCVARPEHTRPGRAVRDPGAAAQARAPGDRIDRPSRLAALLHQRPGSED
ncbi:hypothetical protein [Streptomyces adonidis]|uniref:hypothetical protein n=1 Tax=Streptomyces adonidis TaxID=3231367 RepID=UPI0034DAF04A